MSPSRNIGRAYNLQFGGASEGGKALEIQPSDVLLVVDIQNDFCPGGALAVSGGDEIVPIVNALMDRFENVILTQDWHPPHHQSFASSHPDKSPFELIELDYGPQVLWPDHCVQGTPGAGFHRDLHVDRAQMVIRKGFRTDVDSYSAFMENDKKTTTGLAGCLSERGLRRIFVCGIATDVCVKATALDARASCFDVVLIEAASRGIDRDGSMASSRAEMAAAGVDLLNDLA